MLHQSTGYIFTCQRRDHWQMWTTTTTDFTGNTTQRQIFWDIPMQSPFISQGIAILKEMNLKKEIVTGFSLPCPSSQTMPSQQKVTKKSNKNSRSTTKVTLCTWFFGFNFFQCQSSSMLEAVATKAGPEQMKQ